MTTRVRVKVSNVKLMIIKQHIKHGGACNRRIQIDTSNQHYSNITLIP